MSGYEDQFVGVWELQNWTVTHLESGAQNTYFGGREQGFIIYTADGWVSSSIHDSGRPMNTDDRTARIELQTKIAEEGCAGLTPEQYEVLTPFALSAFGYLGYCGPYRADAENVHHTVRSAGRTSHVGLVLTRSYKFEGEMLRLIGDAFGYRDTLLWKRITPAPGGA